MRLKDKVAIITGAGSASARRPPWQWPRRRASRRRRRNGRCEDEDGAERSRGRGGHAVAMTADVTRAADTSTCRRRGRGVGSTGHLLRQRPGVPQWKTDVEEVDEKTFDTIFDVNVRASTSWAKTRCR